MYFHCEAVVWVVLLPSYMNVGITLAKMLAVFQSSLAAYQCWSSEKFYQPCQRGKVRSDLSRPDLERLIYGLISTHLDDCNSVGISQASLCPSTACAEFHQLTWTPRHELLIPSYLTCYLTTEQTRSLKSANQQLLRVENRAEPQRSRICLVVSDSLCCLLRFLNVLYK